MIFNALVVSVIVHSHARHHHRAVVTDQNRQVDRVDHRDVVVDAHDQDQEAAVVVGVVMM